MPPESLNPAKARTAAKHPQRPGEDCRAAPGTRRVVIDRGKCEGKGDCVEVCPYGVFEVGRITDADFAALTILGKVKSLAHRRKTAYTPKLDACQACGMCVVACPESAIALR
jgi:4Fe-4S ferredoxin